MSEPEIPPYAEDAPPVPDAEPNAAPSVDALRAELDDLRRQLRDQQLRGLAEMDNVRKRAEREIAAGARYGTEKLLGDLLAICDSLELGLKAVAASDAAASIAEGLTLTHRQLVGVLDKHGVKAVDPQGEAFNPELHEAVAAVPSAEVAPNHVVEVMQKGYRLHERLLRPARVVVAQAATPGG